MRARSPAIQKYLDSIRGTGAVSEIALYKPFAQYILGELLGYPDNCLALNERQARDVPDIKLYPQPRTRQQEGEVWAIAEGKLKDQDLRDAANRQRIWQEQVRRYIRPETFRVLLFAPETFCICDVAGRVEVEVHLGADGVQSSVRGAAWQEAPLEDAALRQLLAPVSWAEAQRRPQYELFGRGESPAGYLALTRETLPLLEEVFLFGLRELRSLGARVFEALEHRYALAQAEMAQAQHEADIEIDDRRHGILMTRVYRLKRKQQSLMRLFEADYPEFCYDQSYAGTEERDFRDIFVTNSVHILLSRLLFVRLCEDSGFIKRKVSNAGVGYWRRLVEDFDPRYQDLLKLAFHDVQPIYAGLFEEGLFDWLGDLNGDLNSVLEQLLFRLNAFSFAQLDRDLLGTMYQTFRPRAERKRLGEYYTPAEVADFILQQVGYLDDAELLQKRLLDPSCGSFTFGVRAARVLLERAQHLAPRQRLELVQCALTGYDINAFSAFLGHLSLVFMLLQDYREAKAAEPGFRLHAFGVQRMNTLTTGIGLAAGNGENGSRSEEHTFHYVVGNPPFVRNERLPAGDREDLRARYPEIASGNTDLSAYFLQASVKWLLKDGGRLGMVAPIGLANAKAVAYVRRLLETRQLEGLVSLEWMAKELFPDADIVPMLIFLRNAPPSPRDGTIRLVHGLRSKADLERATHDASFRTAHTSKLPVRRWRNLSPTGDWPLEVTAADLPIQEKLRARPTWEQSRFVLVRYAVKLGREGQGCVRPAVPTAARRPQEVPFIKGHHIAAFHVSEADELADLRKLGQAADLSLWNTEFLAFLTANRGKHDETGFGRHDYKTAENIVRAPSDITCALVPSIYVRLLAATMDPVLCCANDSTIACFPCDSSAHVLAALLNSTLMSYYGFLLMRAAILLRRRSTWYPRTLLNLPYPELTKPAKKRLHRLAREAAELSLEADAARDEAAVFLRAMRTTQKREKLGILGLAAPGTPFETCLETDDLGVVDRRAGKLEVGPVALTAPDADLLLLTRAALLASEAESLSVAELQDLPVPQDAAARHALAGELASVEEDLLSAQGRMTGLLAQIDETVAEGLGLTAAELETIRQRCQEFPLSVTVGAPRFVWSPDRKRQARRTYPDADRFKA